MEKHYISAAEFAERYRRGEFKEALIIDVREPYEWEQYHLNEATHIPMNTIPEQLDRLDKEKDIYVICAHGVRSWHVMNYLLQQGWEKVINVEGGMAEVYFLVGEE